MKKLFPGNFDDVGSFSDGITYVRLNDWWGLIDKKGKGITPIKYDKIGEVKNGLISVQIGGRWGFIDINGSEYFED